MPRKKLTHPFQLELLRQQKDKDRIVRELKLRQRIYTFAELSEKERKGRFAFLIAEKRIAAEDNTKRNYLNPASWTVIPISTKRQIAKTVFLTKRGTLQKPLIHASLLSELSLGFS